MITRSRLFVVCLSLALPLVLGGASPKEEAYCSYPCFDMYSTFEHTFGACVNCSNAGPHSYRPPSAQLHHTPSSEFCSSGHAPCWTGDAGEVFDRAIRVGDYAAIRAGLERWSRFASFDPKRTSIQLIDCEGRLVADLPLNAEAAAELQSL